MSDTMEMQVLHGEDPELDPGTRAQLQRGDAATWEAAFRSTYEPLYGYCRRLAASDEAAQDLVQEAFARSMQRCRSRGAPTRLRPFLFTVARNLWLDSASA